MKCKSPAVGYWLFLGTLPSLMWNAGRLPEWFNEIFSSIGSSGTFFIDGPIFSNLKYLVTCNPKNIEYILKNNFNNFPKGKVFNEVFNILGEGIFNVDYDLWRVQRKMAHASFTSGEFKTLVANISHKLVEEQLVPFLVHTAENGCTIDLQDIFQRFAYDSSMKFIFGRNEKYLSLQLPYNELVEAANDSQEVLLYRHGMPVYIWKLLHWLGVGRERKMSKAHKLVMGTFDEFIFQKRQDLLEGAQTVDLLSSYMRNYNEISKSDKFLRDAMVSFFVAGRDTISSGLTWFFWIVSKTPAVEVKILEELKLSLSSSSRTSDDKMLGSKWPQMFDFVDLKKLVYLHAALCESLRLYPPVPLNRKSAIKEDMLPDGTSVKPGTEILLSFYSVGRMPWIWGEDCLEFKPERWIDEDGKISFEPVSKFFAFNVGPRTCIGKDMSFTQMKSVVATLLFNFHIEVIKGQQPSAKPNINLHMKSGLKVKIKKRDM